MTAQPNKVIVAYYVDSLNQRRFDVLDEVVAADVAVGSLLRSGRAQPAEPIGRAAYSAAIRARIAAFPDYDVTIDEMLVEADQVVVCWRSRGTHRGEFLGVAPTGKVIEEAAISIYRLAGGRIVEIRGFWDIADTWRQLGLLPDDGLPA